MTLQDKDDFASLVANWPGPQSNPGANRMPAVGEPWWGSRHCSQPADDGLWHTYRTCCTSSKWVGEALAARLMRAENIWNHPAFFDYTDKYIQDGGGYGDDWMTGPFIQSVWDTYRDNLPEPVGVGNRIQNSVVCIQKPTLHLYENPVGEKLVIGFSGTPLSGTVTIYNAQGSPIRQAEVKDGQTTLGLRGLANGVYFYRIGKNRASMFIKTR